MPPRTGPGPRRRRRETSRNTHAATPSPRHKHITHTGFVGFFVKLVHIPINNILMT
jgi:hypothetical protein